MMTIVDDNHYLMTIIDDDHYLCITDTPPASKKIPLISLALIKNLVI